VKRGLVYQVYPSPAPHNGFAVLLLAGMPIVALGSVRRSALETYWGVQ
jgi:hypothetical protein